MFGICYQNLDDIYYLFAKIWKFKFAGLSTLVGLLKHEDEAIVGNAALCLSHLTDLPKVPAKLTKTNIIQVSVLYKDHIASICDCKV